MSPVVPSSRGTVFRGSERLLVMKTEKPRTSILEWFVRLLDFAPKTELELETWIRLTGAR